MPPYVTWSAPQAYTSTLQGTTTSTGRISSRSICDVCTEIKVQRPVRLVQKQVFQLPHRETLCIFQMVKQTPRNGNHNMRLFPLVLSVERLRRLNVLKLLDDDVFSLTRAPFYNWTAKEITPEDKGFILKIMKLDLLKRPTAR